jgi:hypothetical protein
MTAFDPLAMTNEPNTPQLVTVKSLKPGQAFSQNGVRYTFVKLERRGTSDFGTLYYRFEGSAVVYTRSVTLRDKVEVEA